MTGLLSAYERKLLLSILVFKLGTSKNANENIYGHFYVPPRHYMGDPHNLICMDFVLWVDVNQQKKIGVEIPLFFRVMGHQIWSRPEKRQMCRNVLATD